MLVFDVGAIQTKNIQSYAKYMEEKIGCYRDIYFDWVGKKEMAISNVRGNPLNADFFRTARILQRQIDALLTCSVGDKE
jgi:phosphatidylinositol-binding clathrin assembly protein